MKTLITEFISLDGVVQAPGGPTEDTDGGFAHGGWSMKYFDPEVMGGMFTELAERYKDRDGGYIRVLKAGFRKSDASPMAIIELVDRNEDAKGQDSGPVEVDDETAAA